MHPKHKQNKIRSAVLMCGFIECLWDNSTPCFEVIASKTNIFKPFKIRYRLITVSCGVKYNLMWRLWHVRISFQFRDTIKYGNSSNLLVVLQAWWSTTLEQSSRMRISRTLFYPTSSLCLVWNAWNLYKNDTCSFNVINY